MDDARAALAHLFSCVDTTYRVLGEHAPSFSRDACVLGAYVAARAVGEVGLDLRAYLGAGPGEPVGVLEEVLVRSSEDATGVLALFCLVSVVGPRLLVSLRDAREFLDLDEEARAVLGRASSALVGALHAAGAAVGAAGADLAEDEGWQERARDLARTLDAAGYAESFGLAP